MGFSLSLGLTNVPRKVYCYEPSESLPSLPCIPLSLLGLLLLAAVLVLNLRFVRLRDRVGGWWGWLKLCPLPICALPEPDDVWDAWEAKDEGLSNVLFWSLVINWWTLDSGRPENGPTLEVVINRGVVSCVLEALVG